MAVLDEAAVQEINSLRWFHQLDFGNGVLSPGVIRASKLKRVSQAVFDRPITGKTVLDIGCWDGAQSIEATRRGASRVLATDHHSWNEAWGNRRCFDIARARLAPSVEVMDIDVPDLVPERVGTFDVVLFLGVLYHLKNPFAMIEHVSKLVGELLVLETRIVPWPSRRPYMRFWPDSTLEGDPTNWWTPNTACVKAMLHEVGFTKVTARRIDWRFRRCVFHAER